MNIKTLLLTSSLLLLTACGEQTSIHQNTSSNQTGQKESGTTEVIKKGSILAAYLSADTVCDALDVKDLQQLFKTTAAIEAEGTSYRTNHTCNYLWDRPDAAAREKVMMDNMMKMGNGDGEKIPLRQKTTNYQFSLTLSESKQSAANFMPAKLSEEQLQDRIKAVQTAADKSLTDEQKALAGEAANAMVERLMQQNNQNQAVEGIGDAAYWNQTGSGGLNVLDGDTQIYIGPLIADTETEDLINAKNIVGLLLK